MVKPKRINKDEITKPIKCLCPQCGYETYNEKNKLCTSIKCPVCKTKLINK